MRRSVFGLAVLLVMSAPRAHAGHLFSENSTAQGQVALLPQQGVEVTIDQIFSDTNSNLFSMSFNFDQAFSGLAQDQWSTGDILRFTMNGFSLDFDFDNPLANTTTNLGFTLVTEVMSADPGFTQYDDQLLVNNTFTLELLAGDGLQFAGFTLADRIGATNALTSAGFATYGPVFQVPEPSTFLLLGLGLVSQCRRKAKADR